LSVTDLLSPRRAFWRRMRGPAPLPLEREARLERGRSWHRRLGDAVAAEGRLEVRLRRGSLSGRIDLLADVPVEIKTNEVGPSSAGSIDWPDQVEQLAIYCAALDSPTGRLVHLSTPEGRPPEVSVGELKFRDLGAVDEEIRGRVRDLREALESERTEALPRCRWIEVGCEYRTQGLCDCRGDEEEGPGTILASLEGRTPRPEIAARWSAALRERPDPAPPWPDRFRELLYPRRAYFDRTAGRPAIGVPPRPAGAPLDAYERTMAALEGSAAGDLHRLRSGAGAPAEEVLAWRGEPCAVRSSRLRTRLTAADLVSRFPQYVVDLGFRCAATGAPGGTLFLGHDAPARGAPSLQVYRLELGSSLPALSAASRDRAAALESAISRKDPAGLPACADWMVAECAYRSDCGCPADTGRSQR